MWDFLKFFNPRALRRGIITRAKPYKTNEDLIKFVNKHYKCPQTDLVTELKKPKQDFVKKLAKLAKTKKGSWLDEISPGFFITIILCIQCSLHEINNHIMLYTKFAPWMVMIFCSVIYTFICMPLYMAFFFLSNYTRNSYVKFWLVAPVFKGLGFAVAILNCLSCIINMSLVALYLIFIYALFANWLECGYPGLDKNECVFATHSDALCPEPGMGMPKVGTYTFLKYVVTSSFGDTINSYWIATLVVLYFIVMLCELYAKILFGIMCRMAAFVMAFVFFLIWIYEMMYGTRYSMIQETSGDLTDMLQGIFWIACGKAALRRTLPGDLISYGSITVSGTSPVTIGVLLAVIRIIFTSNVANMYAISLNVFVENHKIQHTDCIERTGLTVLFCILPDQILQWKMSKLFLIVYFICAVIIGTTSTLLSISGFLRAFNDDNSEHSKNRNNIVVLLTIIMCVINIVAVGYGFEYILSQDSKIYIGPLICYSCVAFFIASYSPLRICNDFYFAYGRPLAGFWSSTMKLYVIFVMSILVMYIVFEAPNLKVKNELNANLIGLTFILVPIVVFALLRIYTARRQKIKVISPDQDWGAPNKTLRQGRQAFDPKRECRIARNLQCKHECLVQSKLLIDFMFESQDKFKSLQEKYTNALARHRTVHVE